jgi:hypothetical protein
MRLMALVLAAGFLWPACAFGQFRTGNDLYAKCTASAGPERTECIGIVIGLADAFVYDEKTCPPDGITVRQVEDLIVKYLRDHPELRHHSAPSLARTALQQAFPCK